MSGKRKWDAWGRAFCYQGICNAGISGCTYAVNADTDDTEATGADKESAGGRASAKRKNLSLCGNAVRNGGQYYSDLRCLWRSISFLK